MFFKLEAWGLEGREFTQKDLQVIPAQVGGFEISISKEFPCKTYKQTCMGQAAHLLTGLFITEALVM